MNKIISYFIFTSVITLYLTAAPNESAYRLEEFENRSPFIEAAIDDEYRRIRRPSSIEEIYQQKFEQQYQREWQDMEENCGDKCMYPDRGL